ncbi:MAG: DUF3987 domain-containing protein [Chloroflexota bacterium]
MIDQKPLATPQAAVNGLFELLKVHSGSRSTGKAVRTGLTGSVDALSPLEARVLGAALSSRFGEALTQIWQRTDADAVSVSEEDWALENELAYQVVRAGIEGDAVALTVEHIMRAGPYRSKWDELRNGVSWLAQDVANAVQTVTDRLMKTGHLRTVQVDDEEGQGYFGPNDQLRTTAGSGPATARIVPVIVCSEPWGEPSHVLGLPPAPHLDLTVLPLEIERVTRDASERLQCAPDYVAWGALTCMAGLIGRGVGIRPRQRDDWTERAALWTVNIGDPSSLKSPSLEESRRTLRRQEALDRSAYEVELEVWEDQCDAIRADAKARREKNPTLPAEPAETRRATSDATIEKLADLMQNSPGLTLVRDEISGLVGSFNRYAKGEGDRQFYLEAYSGGAYTVDRIGRGTVRVADLYLSILGGTQPDKARELFGEGPDDGFAARVNGIYPEMSREWREIDRYPDRAARNALNAIADRLVNASWSDLIPGDEWKPLPYVRLSPAAGELWSEWQTDLMRRLRSGDWEGRHAGRIGKYPGLAARLTLVWHLIDWAAGRVCDDDLRLVPDATVARVLDLMDGYVAPMDVRVYRAFDRSQAANGGERIARWIAESHAESFTLREVRRHGWTGLGEPRSVEAAVEWLAAMAWVREADSEQRPGRPANRFEVNPRVWEATDTRAS